GPFTQRADRFRVDAHRQCRLVLGAVDRGVRRGVDDQVGPDAVEVRAQAFEVREIHALAFRAIELAVARGGDDFAGAKGLREPWLQFARGIPQCDPQRVADLAIGAEQQDARAHGEYAGNFPTATSERNGATLSLSDKNGSATGQSMASCASFQRTPASAARSYTAVHW